MATTTTQKINSTINAKVNGMTFEDYFAQSLALLEEKEIDVEKEKIKNNRMKQYNNYLTNVIEVRRLELKEAELTKNKECGKA